MIKVFLPFEPQAKRAQTAAKAGNKVWVVDPDKAMKADIANEVLATLSPNQKPLKGPLSAFLTFRFSIPDSIPKKEAARRFKQRWAAEVRKDLDNCCKLYLDSLNFGPLKGKIFEDDHWICRLSTEKIWGEIPGISIELEELGSETEDFF